MHSKTLIVLIAAAAAGVGITALVVTPSRTTDVSGSAGAAEAVLVKGLVGRVNDVASVQVRTGDAQFTMQRDAEGRWTMVEKGGYPVLYAKIKPAIVGLAELKNLEPKTSRPERYADLGVQDPGQPVAEGQQAPVSITLADSAGQQMAAVIVGNAKPSSIAPGVYVRRVGESQSYLAEGVLELQGEPITWMETKLLELPRDRVQSVTITHAGGEVLRISREKPEDGSFVVHDVPEGKELRSPNAGDPLGAALSWLGFEDVARASMLTPEGETGSPPKWTADFRTFDGLVLVIHAYDKDGRIWCRITPVFDSAVAAAIESRPPSLKSPEAAKKEAEDLSEALTPWAFAIPEWKATPIGATMASLLKDTPPEAPASMEGIPTINPAELVEPPPHPEPQEPEPQK